MSMLFSSCISCDQVKCICPREPDPLPSRPRTMADYQATIPLKLGDIESSRRGVGKPSEGEAPSK